MYRSYRADPVWHTVIVLALSVGAAAGAAVASQWTVLRQGDFPTHFQDMAWSPDGAAVVAVGDDGAVFLSTDGGSTWQARDSGVATDLLSVAWPATDTLWVCGERPAGWGAFGDLVRSTDGGTTWSAVIADNPNALTSVFFVDPGHGWVGEPIPELLRTTDAGDTWHRVSTVDTPTATLEFLNTHVGHAAGMGVNFTLFRSIDGGVSWEPVYDSPSGTIVGITFASANEGFLADPMSVSVTLDGGLTWALTADLGPVWLSDISFATGAVGWVVGHHQEIGNEDALIERSDDGGRTWAPQVLLSPNSLRAVAARDTAAAVAGGTYGTLARTTDGGASWQPCFANPANDMLDLEMIDADVGWAVGPPAMMQRTTDGGATWARVAGTGDDTLEAFHRVDQDHMFACGSFTFIASTDGGAAWEERYTSMDCHALHFADPQTGIAGTRHGIFRTTDGGFSWDFDGSGAGFGGVFDFHFVTATLGFAAAGIERILRTTDGGVTWDVVHEPPPPNVYLSAIHFGDASHGWAVGDEGLILVTTDGGATWAEQPGGVAVHLRDVHFWNATEGIVVGDSGYILDTTDGGASWQPATSPTDADLHCIEAVDPTRVWIGGAWGTVIVPGTSSEAIFADGFESGDTSAWSTTAGG